MRGHTNGLDQRPHHIYRSFTPEQREANGRKGGSKAGQARSLAARAKIRQYATDALLDNGYDKAIMPVLIDAFEVVYSAGYRNGYQAVYQRTRRAQAKREREAA